MDKAEFRANRERIGLSQKALAHTLGKSIETIKKWEKPGYFPPAPEAVDAIDRLMDEHRKAVARLVDTAIDGEDHATLNYYRSQAHYEDAGRDGDHTMADAQAREAAAILEERGIKVSFAYPEDRLTCDMTDVTYDLSDWDWLDQPVSDRPRFLHFTASDGRGHEVSIITNRVGEGKFVANGGAYDQVVGTSQYELPVTREDLRGELSDMWARVFSAVPHTVDDEIADELSQRAGIAAEESEARWDALAKRTHDHCLEKIAKAWTTPGVLVDCERNGRVLKTVERDAIFHDFPIRDFDRYVFRTAGGEKLASAALADMNEFRDRHPELIGLGTQEVRDLAASFNVSQDVVRDVAANHVRWETGRGFVFDGGGKNDAYGEIGAAVECYLFDMTR